MRSRHRRLRRHRDRRAFDDDLRPFVIVAVAIAVAIKVAVAVMVTVVVAVIAAAADRGGERPRGPLQPSVVSGHGCGGEPSFGPHGEPTLHKVPGGSLLMIPPIPEFWPLGGSLPMIVPNSPGGSLAMMPLAGSGLGAVVPLKAPGGSFSMRPFADAVPANAVAVVRAATASARAVSLVLVLMVVACLSTKSGIALRWSGA